MQTELIAPAERAGLLKRLVAGELPDARGRFGPFGGRYAPETLIPALERLEAGLRRYLRDPEYQAELGRELREWVGRYQRECGQQRIDYVRLTTDQPYDAALLRYLEKRRRLH